MGAWEEALNKQEKKKKNTGNLVMRDNKRIEELLKKNQSSKSYFCCLLLGTDGTGKSGIVQDYFAKMSEKYSDKMGVIIDLDGGNIPLLNKYHKKYIEQIKIFDPKFEWMNKLVNSGNLETENDIEFNYKEILGEIKSLINYVATHPDKFYGICFDGLSTFLSYCEQVMRIERHLTPDGGVSMAYWKLRSKIYTEILEEMKSLPMDRFFIGHEDFIAIEEEKLSSVKQKTNQMMYQKILCEREDTPGKVLFNGTIMKSKYSVGDEGKKVTFCEVNKKTKIYTWNIDELVEGLK